MAEILEDSFKTNALPVQDDISLGNVDTSENLQTFGNCQFCSEEAKYKCPRCNAPYCSLPCYKCPNHLNCSEKFYKKLVEDELRNVKQDSVSKKKMMEILQRVNKNSNSADDEELSDQSDDNEDDIVERMQGVDLDDPDSLWSKLTEEEQKEFLDIIKTGKTTDIIPPWKPWWEATRPVEEIISTSDIETPTFMENCPSIVSCPLLASIMKSSPSPCIPFNIVNVLASYVWVARIFNGDHQDNCIDACEALFTLSPVLSKASNFESAQVAVTTPKMESQNYPWLRESEEFNSIVQKDVQKIIEGPNSSFPAFFIVSALSDVHALLNSCNMTKTAKPRPRGAFSASFGGTNEEIEKKFICKELIKKSIKKIEFFLSYMQEYPKILCKT